MEDNLNRVASTGYPNAPPPPRTRSPASRCLFATLAFAPLPLMILYFIMSFTYPRLPVFHVSSFSLSSFNISTSPSLITGNWDYRLTAFNPDVKTTIRYGKINASLFYKNVFISQTVLPPFVLGIKNETEVRVTIVLACAYVERKVMDGIGRDMSTRNLGFDLKLEGDFKYKLYWLWKIRSVRVYCKGLAIGNSSLIDKVERNCRVRVPN